MDDKQQRPRAGVIERTLLWGSGQTSLVDRPALEAAAREFSLTVRFCGHRELAELARAGRTELIGIELDADPNDALALVKELVAHLPGATVFAASDDTSVARMRLALEAGAGDFLSLPLDARELRKTLLKCTEGSARSARTASGEIIAVYGVRGGLGVTTLAVNLASKMLALTNAPVALVDLDLQRGDIAAFLNLTPIYSLASIANSRGQLDDMFLSTLLTRHAGGVYVLPAPPMIEEADSITHEDIARTLNLMRGRFAHTIVDTPRTITGSTVAAFETADRILVVSDLSVPSVRAARRTIELLGRLEVADERIELVLTQSIPGPVDPKDAARTIRKQPLQVIPRDEATASAAMNAGTLLNGVRPAGLTLAVYELAGNLAGIEAQSKTRRRFFQRMFPKG